MRAVAVEGDSTDSTARDLKRGVQTRDLDLTVYTHNHGGPVWGSTENPARLAALSGVANKILDGVRESDDVLLYVESDLIWTPESIYQLIGYLDELKGVDVVAPLVFAGRHFYDVWAFRGLDGNRFSPFPPYHADLTETTSDCTFVSSVGSCLVMSERVARQVRICNGQALVGWCEEARRLGYGIVVAPNVRVEHPA